MDWCYTTIKVFVALSRENAYNRVNTEAEK